MQEDKPYKEKIEEELKSLKSVEQSTDTDITLVDDQSKKDSQDSIGPELRTDQGPWLLVPRINCDGPTAERLIHKPSIIIGMIVGLMLPFLFLKMALVFHFHLSSWQANLLLLVAFFALLGQFRLTRYLTYKFRMPFFVEFAFGVLYPFAKLLSLVGVNWLEGMCFITLGDVNQEFNNAYYAADCSAKVLSFDKPFSSFSVGNELEYAQSLLISGQVERAKIFVDERFRYWKSLHAIDNSSAGQAFSDYAIRGYFASIIYELAGDLDKAIELKREVLSHRNSSLISASYNVCMVAGAELLFSQGKYSEALQEATSYLDKIEGYNWNGEFERTSFMKSRVLILSTRCYIELGDKEKAVDTANEVGKIVTKDRSTINLLGEQLMLAELESEFDNKQKSKEILECSFERFATPQTSYTSKIIQRKAKELGFPDLSPKEVESIEPEQISCSHNEEDCSFTEEPVCIVAEHGVFHLSLQAGFIAAFVGFIGSLLGHISTKNLYEAAYVLVPVLIILLVLGAMKSERMARLRSCIKEGNAIPVLICVDAFKVEIFDRETGKSYGSLCINEKMHEALRARATERVPAKMYKEGNEILGLEIFGYASMVSEPKK